MVQAVPPSDAVSGKPMLFQPMHCVDAELMLAETFNCVCHTGVVQFNVVAVPLSTHNVLFFNTKKAATVLLFMPEPLRNASDLA